MSFVTCRFVFREDGYVYTFQCYEFHRQRIDIIRHSEREPRAAYDACLHNIDNGEIRWTGASHYIPESARKFGNRIVKLLAFT